MSSVSQAEPQVTTWKVDLAHEQDTQQLAEEVVLLIGANDLITLSGDLGAGKTTFARALIRRLAGEAELEVPSPTFTLMQIYETPRFPIVHADLYRIKHPDEIVDLGWDEASEGALLVVEWADRLGETAAADSLDICFTLDLAKNNQARTATLTGHGKFAARLVRARAIHDLLVKGGWGDSIRHHMIGDASSRAYERLVKPNGETAILMISPPNPDNTPIRLGKTYSAIAKRAENITAFLAMAEGLREQGLSSPKCYAADTTAGLAILEDFGVEGVSDASGPIVERYAEALQVLAYLHGQDLPKQVHFGDLTHDIPPYDVDALAIEVELLTDWYVPHVARKSLSSAAKAQFVNVWRRALHEMIHSKQTWVMRDFHSPNLMWLPQRSGLQRVGLLDFQDCLLGLPAYDVASLLQDARLTVPDALEMKLLRDYLAARRAQNVNFDVVDFAKAYALMGAQRATKILGIFARLDKRDAKPQYLKHMPRMEHYLAKGLAHPALRDLRTWFVDYLPHLVGDVK